MSVAEFKTKISNIIRTPGRERLVSGAGGELHEAQVAGKEPRNRKGDKIPMCAFDCGYPAAKGSDYCEDCGKGLTKL